MERLNFKSEIGIAKWWILWVYYDIVRSVKKYEVALWRIESRLRCQVGATYSDSGEDRRTEGIIRNRSSVNDT